MGFLDWARSIFVNGRTEIMLKDLYYEASVEVHYKRLAIETCVDLIAKTLSKCEIQTFEKGEPVRKENYYLFNVQPNQNQNATEFLYKAVTKYFYSGECLIVMLDDQMYIAESFEVAKYALKPNVYKEIYIDDFKLGKTFYENEVIHLKLSDENILNAINSLYSSYGKLLASAMNYYRRKNNKRLLIKGDFLRPQDEATQKAIDDMFENQLKNWFDPNKEGSAFQLQDGYILDDMSDSKDGKDSNSRDISNLVDDIINFIAMALHVPRGMLKGDIADIEKQVDSFIMFAISPIAEVFADEYNRKMYTKQQFLDRTYMKVDTSKAKIIDINQLSNAIDKLFAVGGVTINDILDMLGKNPVNEDYANERYVTKNYQKAKDASTAEGGE